MENKNRSVHLLIILLCAFPSLLVAQDLIVKTTGDSLNCKIKTVKDHIVYYSTFKNNATRDTCISVWDVKRNHVDFYLNSGNYKQIKKRKHNFDLSLGLSYGYSHASAGVSDKVPEVLKSYEESTRSGYNISIDSKCFIWKNAGVGLQYSFFRSENNIDNIYVTFPNGVQQAALISDDITMHYFGPSVNQRFISTNHKFSMCFDYGIGYYTFKNEATLVTPYIWKGNTIGTNFGFYANYLLLKTLSIELRYTDYTGVLYHIDKQSMGQNTTNPDDNTKLDISRIDFSIGLRWKLIGAK